MFQAAEQKGFTLIEVMIAVAILGVALPALLFSMISQLQSNEYVRDKLMATWVAENVLSEQRLANRLSGQIKKGKDEGSAIMGQQRWFFKTESKAFAQAQFKDIYGIEILVYKEQLHSEKDQPVVRLVGILREFNNSRLQMPTAELPTQQSKPEEAKKP